MSSFNFGASQSEDKIFIVVYTIWYSDYDKIIAIGKVYDFRPGKLQLIDINKTAANLRKKEGARSVDFEIKIRSIN